MVDNPTSEEQRPDAQSMPEKKTHTYLCDCCGFEMTEKNCKIVCPNCGSRYDCSDLNIYFD
jgi:rubrerythrin